MADRVGQQLSHYRLIRLIGKSDVAEVYLGEHVSQDTQAAVKVWSLQLTSEEEKRFQEEARLVARLSHPHIARIFDFGVEEGMPFLVMDYAPNGTLRKQFPRATPQAPGTILPYVWQVADALHYAHGQRLIHQDLKPDNILLDARNEILLSDFAIGAIFQGSRYQSNQEIADTALYMAPEQIQGHPHPASDQYALAAITYEWLSGAPPFEGSMTDVMAKHLFTEPPPLHERVRTISPAIEAVVTGALSKDQADRFPSILSFATAFEDACQAVPTLLFMSPRLIALPTKEDQDQNDSAIPTIPMPAVVPPSAPSAGRATNPASTAATHMPSFSGSVVSPVAGPSTTLEQPAPGAPWQELDWTPAPAAPGAAPLFQPQVQPRQGLSRRAILIGGAAGLVVVGGGLAWLGLSELHARTSRSSSPATSTATRATATSDPTTTATPILSGATLYTYRGHTSFVRGVSWSPNGKRIASASDDHTIQVWDAFTGANAMTYTGHSREVMAVAWSPNGTSLASGSQDQTLQVWDALTGKALHSFPFGHWVMAVAWSPNGKYLAAGSWDYTVQVWNTTTWQRVHSFSTPGWVNALAWSPDNIHLVSGDGAKLAVVWNVVTGGKILIYRGHTSAVLALAWAPDGRQIASGADFPDTTVQYWSTANGQRLWSANTQDHTPSLAGSADGKRLAAGGGSVYLLNPLTGKQLSSYQRDAWTLAWSPDGKYIASGGSSTTVQVWQTT